VQLFPLSFSNLLVYKMYLPPLIMNTRIYYKRYYVTIYSMNSNNEYMICFSKYTKNNARRQTDHELRYLKSIFINIYIYIKIHQQFFFENVLVQHNIFIFFLPSIPQLLYETHGKLIFKIKNNYTLFINQICINTI